MPRRDDKDGAGRLGGGSSGVGHRRGRATSGVVGSGREGGRVGVRSVGTRVAIKSSVRPRLGV